MANELNVGDKYPGFNRPGVRAHFPNPVSFDKLLNPKRFQLVETFQRLPSINASIGVATNLDFEVLGTGGSADDVTHSATVGGIQLETDASASQEVIILPHLDTSQTAWADVKWGTENQVIWDAVIRTGASVADIVIWAGLKLTNTAVVATDANQIFFRFDAGVANWEATSSIGGTATETDTGIAVAASTIYHFRIEIDADRKGHFYIDDVEVASTAALTNDIDLIPYVGVQGDAKSIVLVKEAISRIVFE